MAILKDHKAIGMKVEYPTERGIVNGFVIAVRQSPKLLMNIEKLTIESAKLIELKIQPNDGGRAFWSQAIQWNEEPAALTTQSDAA